MMRAAAALIALLALTGCRSEATQAKPKPDLYVLTSLPLLFDEGFGLEPVKGEAATFLRDRYTLKPIDLPSQLPKGAVLLAAQPRALPAEELVALDKWVRDGGKLLLLADPMLEWPSERAFGDRLRPPVSFADTGLLAHWGLRLDAPDDRGAKRLGGGHFPILFFSPGRLVSGTSACQLHRADIEATCRIGRGKVIVVADADWLNEQLVTVENGTFANQMVELDSMIADSNRNLR